MAQNNMICVTQEATVRDTIQALDNSAIGLVLLVDADDKFLQTITDGDMRRLMLGGAGQDDTITNIPAAKSITVDDACTPKTMMDLMDKHVIDHLPVLDDAGFPVRVVCRRDLGNPILLSTPHIGDAELSYVMEAFSSNWIAPLGPNVDQFEAEIAQLVGSPAACALSSGTAAIHLGLKLLDVAAGDTVFVSDFTFAASVNPILYLGAEPVLIDSEPDSWNMSPKALAAAFEAASAAHKLPKAVIVVNLYGQSADMDPLSEICAKYGVPIFEDAAESLGAKYKGRSSGTIGALGCFSFNGNKIITTSGGGMLIGQDPELVQRARHLASQARENAPWYEHTEVGYNYRLSNILAGVGRGQLKVLADRVNRRREIGDLYREGLKGLNSITWMPEPEWSFSNRWLSCITLDASDNLPSPDRLIADLKDNRIEARHLWKPMHMQPFLKGCTFYAHDETPVSENLFSTGLCLPSGSNMDTGSVHKIIDVLVKSLS